MIRVENLTKRYGETLAIDDVSFEVGEGEIVGFLGPNGAGKSTTMRILTGYLAATSGEAWIAGHDIFTESLAARRVIGYLPEAVPLYEEMRVQEYLRFRSRIKEVPRGSIRLRVAEAMDRADITSVSRKLIGQLSKGYRQRVGIAAALLHRPKVLILDEPTVGLDPRQIRSTRHLIHELAGDHTILLSSHILPEVEAICERVLILHRGRVLAMDTPQQLMKDLQGGGGRIRAEVRGKTEAVRKAIEAVDGVAEVEIREVNDVIRLTAECEGEEDLREAVSTAIVAAGGVIRDFRTQNVTLEEVFVHVTTEEREPETGAEIETDPDGEEAAA